MTGGWIGPTEPWGGLGMSVTLTYKVETTAAEDLSAALNPGAPTGGKTIKNSGFNTSLTLDSTTTPAVTKCAYLNATLVAGALVINLTNITGANGVAQDFTGLKVQSLRIVNNGDAAMTFAQGATNAYGLMGATFSFTLQPGQEFTFYGNNATPAVGAGAKNIAVSGTGTDSAYFGVTAG